MVTHPRVAADAKMREAEVANFARQADDHFALQHSGVVFALIEKAVSFNVFRLLNLHRKTVNN